MQSTDAAATTTNRSPIALREMLARISVEIDDAAGLVEGVQDNLSQAIELHDTVPSEQFQSLDLLFQILGDLSRVLAALASMQTVGEQVDTADVLDRCKLSDLLIRLGGGTSSPASRELELF